MTDKVKTGEQLLARQLRSGVRPVVEAIDSLRISFGNMNVSILTPKAETRIRTGYKAAVLLKARVLVIYGDSDKKIAVDVEFPEQYPDEPTAFDVSSADDSDFWTNDRIIRLNDFRIPDVDHDVVSFIKKLRQYATDIYTQDSDNNKLSNEDPIVDSPPLHEPTTQIDSNEGDFLMNASITCKLCRNPIIGPASSFMSHSRLVINEDGHINTSSRCTSIFLSAPPTWLVGGDEAPAGKLTCTKCSTRIGQWSWIGNPCSCNVWISPAFQLTLSKVDIKHV